MVRGGTAVDVPVQGDVQPGFGAVADVFRRQLASRRGGGAACAAVREGELVVDLWGGHRDRDRSLPWERDTMVPVFSTTKGLATMALLVAHARGRFDFDDPVADHWPEFAQAGKADITIRDLLSHRAGLAALDQQIGREVVADPDRLADVLARQRPLWEPGTAQGYHAWTLGFYEGELFRRVDPAGRSLGRAVAEDVAGPLGVEFHVGLSPDVPDDRLATFLGMHLARALVQLGDVPRGLLLGLMNPRGLTARAFGVLPMVRDPNEINDRDLLALELPAVGGVGHARGIATVYGELATGGARLGLGPDTLDEVEAAPAPPPAGSRDLVLRFDIDFQLGFGKPSPGFVLGSDHRAYAMAGAGGSVGAADPALGVGWAYTPSRMGIGSPTDPREVALRDALYGALGGPPQVARRR